MSSGIKHTRLPPLSRSQIRPTQVKVAQVLPYQDWVNMRDGETLTMTTQDLPGVQITLPEEDFELMVQVLAAHYDAVSTNPAVNDAWLKYRMLLAMTRRE
jgi:hypothetical protein